MQASITLFLIRNHSQQYSMENLENKEVKRTERGWAGHFCCAHRCTFHRNTLLEYNGKMIVVSTVGMMRMNNDDIEVIGCDRYYETMCFEADYSDTKYYDINVEKEIKFISNNAIKEKYADNKANDMHEAVVSEISDMMVNNKIEYEKY